MLFVPGGHSPTGVFVAWCNVGTFVRLCFGVSCDICAGTFLLCDRGHVVTWLHRARRGRGVAVAVALAVFVSPSCGCDTPMNASVRNGFGVVCIGSICVPILGRV